MGALLPQPPKASSIELRPATENKAFGHEPLAPISVTDPDALLLMPLVVSQAKNLFNAREPDSRWQRLKVLGAAINSSQNPDNKRVTDPNVF